MAFQFFHIDVISRTVPKKSVAKRWSLAEVLAEVNRAAAACPHVESPRKPRHLFGLLPQHVEREVVRLVDEARDVKGRKLRKDSPVMLAGVLSYPIAWADIDERSRVDLATWEERSLRWLTGRFGDTLASVVSHDDEAFPHLHFFVVPHLTGEGRLDVEAVHPGISAREAAKRAGKSAKEANRAYCEAMRTLQDEFHTQVGAFHGHLRMGPRRRRLSRGAYLAEQREAERRGEAMVKVENELERLHAAVEAGDVAKRRVGVLEGEATILRSENRGLNERVRSLEKHVAVVEANSATHRQIARHTSSVLVQLIGLLATGANRCREALLSTSRPALVEEKLWTRFRSLLMPKSGLERVKRRQRGRDRE